MATRVSPAVYGWSGVAAVVVAYDAWALLNGKETMSGFFCRMVDPPQPEERRGFVTAVRAACIGGWMGLSWHLLNNGRHILPEPFHGRYRRAHPLWRLHDIAASRVPISTVTGVLGS